MSSRFARIILHGVRLMPFVETGGARIHYAIEGADGAPVLAFSNSLGTNYSMWDPQAQELRKTFRILRYDTVGTDNPQFCRDRIRSSSWETISWGCWMSCISAPCISAVSRWAE